jgi:hypothetical protein
MKTISSHLLPPLKFHYQSVVLLGAAVKGNGSACIEFQLQLRGIITRRIYFTIFTTDLSTRPTQGIRNLIIAIWL